MSLSTPSETGAKRLLGAEELRSTLYRLACELRERYPEGGAVLCGIVTRGAFLAARLQALIRLQGGGDWTAVRLDVGPFRDDAPRPPAQEAGLPLPPAQEAAVDDRVVVLVDDVLFHGRTCRAALAALHALGRPKAVELMVVVDRGHRELPLRATYVGRNLPTSEAERISVRLAEADGQDEVLLVRPGGESG